MPPEGQARALLRGHPGDGLETWLAEQRWRAALDGSWVVVPGRRSVRVIERASVAGAVTSWLIV
jgi:hypothetical protein